MQGGIFACNYRLFITISNISINGLFLKLGNIYFYLNTIKILLIYI
jgi:hypothetical protein